MIRYPWVLNAAVLCGVVALGSSTLLPSTWKERTTFEAVMLWVCVGTTSLMFVLLGAWLGLEIRSRLRPLQEAESSEETPEQGGQAGEV